MDWSERSLRIAAFRDVYAATRRAEEAEERIRDLHLSHGTGQEGHCLLLVGPPGAGKSVALRRYAARHPDVEEELRTRRPILGIEVPPGCTLRSLARTMLAALGDVAPSRANQVEATKRVHTLLRACGVGLVMMDEAHRLIHTDTDRIAYDAADYIVGLLNTNLCPIVLAGQPHIERVVTTNAQLGRRSVGEVYIGAYEWEDKDQREEFRLILSAFEQALHLPFPSRLGSAETALRIHHFSRGLLGPAALLIEEAFKLALDRSLGALSHPLFAEVVDRLRIGDGRRLVNPFVVEALAPAPAAGRDEAVRPRVEEESARRRRRRQPARSEGGHAD
ncbi:AAA family ATPase [Azospirillum brasilense]|uniref:TniB family NTP-binding protein n=1 Tax=Azospirillum argentinense TaxID=2970906 RepID=UPI00190EFD09|nr:TniB family NTP-binding protein [Azospirillum argentinense]MBK3801405.1 AAA family ATPase [Azospirillum argentinense]